MKNLLCIILFVLCITSLKAQTNLIPNPSFELYDTCPNNSLGQINYAIGWSSYRQSPDYFNSCANSTSPIVGVPNNLSGYQQPLGGNAYVGFQAYFTTNYREILGCTLASPLIIGQKYYVNFKVINSGLLDIYHQGFNCCTNKIGARFSSNAYSYTNPAPINNFAHIYTDSIIKDTVNWYTISGSFVADSSYEYIAIGNFFDDLHTDTSRFTPNYCRAYYLVDGVCVSTDSTYSYNWITVEVNSIDANINSISVFPNPTIDNTHITYKGNSPPNVSVYNSLGELVFPKMIFTPNDIELDFEGINEGIYFLQLSFKEKRILKKIIIIN